MALAAPLRVTWSDAARLLSLTLYKRKFKHIDEVYIQIDKGGRGITCTHRKGSLVHKDHLYTLSLTCTHTETRI